MTAFYFFFYIVFSFFHGFVQSATWSADSLLDGQQLYACAGSNVTFHWNYTLDEDEVLGDIQWYYYGQSQELVAISSRGTFLPTPSFSQRVTWVDDAGLTLYEVQVGDSGNYSMEVSIHSNNGALTTLLRRTLTLNISDAVTTDGALHVVQDPDPVYSNTTGQWVIQLQCGHFIINDIPPVDVEWTTPSGHVYNSTSFSQGNFYFHVPMPLETGNYVCSIPTHLATQACLHGNDSQSGVAVRVDSVEARLQLLEKENWDLKHKLAASQAEVKGQLSNLQTSHNQLSTSTTGLQTRLEKLEVAERSQVAFHAMGLSDSTPDAITPLLFNHVIYNQGNAYNPYTGYFNAPYSGLYFFIAKTSTSAENTDEEHDLMVDSHAIDEGFSVDPLDVGSAFPSPVHGVIHLTPGQKVYVKCRAREHLWGSQSSFTGFLLSRDL